MHEEETFQELASLLSSAAPEKWYLLQSIYLFHDGAMKLSEYYKDDVDSDWKSFDTGPFGFDIMDWWEAYHRMVKDTDGNEFKIARATIDSNGDLKLNLSYEVIDPLADISSLKIADSIWRVS